MRNAYRILIKILNPLNLAILCYFPHQDTADSTHTTVTLKIYSKKKKETTCNIDVRDSLFSSSEFVVLLLRSRGLCIIAV
jgi:hypothetical protein